MILTIIHICIIIHSMDFPNLIKEIINTGDMSEAKIADHIGNVSQPTIHRIKTGEIKDPGSRIGFAIVHLHKDVCSDNAV